MYGVSLVLIDIVGDLTDLWIEYLVLGLWLQWCPHRWYGIIGGFRSGFKSTHEFHVNVSVGRTKIEVILRRVLFAVGLYFFDDSLEAIFSELPNFDGIAVLMTTVLGSLLSILMGRTTSGGRDLGHIDIIIRGRLGSGCGNLWLRWW